jgi:uncharacterized membrane protein YedE/YeeE
MQEASIRPGESGSVDCHVAPSRSMSLNAPRNRTLSCTIRFVGGVLVGFGTRLAGGCSSGHGLSGCGRLRPVSIVATAVFFGTAVGVSFLLWKVI